MVAYKLDLDMEVTSESLRRHLKTYVDDHAGYAHYLKLNSSSISFEGEDGGSGVFVWSKYLGRRVEL